MNNTKHTPTPWILHGKDSQFISSLCSKTKKYIRICEISKTPKYRANSSYIIKCVNEYEALQRKINVMREALIKAKSNAEGVISNMEEQIYNNAGVGFSVDNERDWLKKYQALSQCEDK